MPNAKLLSYKNKYLSQAKQATQGTKIFPDTVIIASALESNYGNSLLSKLDNNFFGIKGKGRKYKTLENRNGILKQEIAEFKKYNSAKDSFKDYVKLLQTDRYKKAGVLDAKNVNDQFKAIKRGGYATDKNYVSKLETLYKNYPVTVATGGGLAAAVLLGSLFIIYENKS